MASPVGLGLPIGLPRKIHDRLPELGKLLACQWLGHIISVHFISWAVLNKDITLLNLIRNKEVTAKSWCREANSANAACTCSVKLPAR